MTEDFSNLIRTVEIFHLSTWEILYPLMDKTTQQLLRETPPQDLIVSGDQHHWIRVLEKAIRESKSLLIMQYTTHGNTEFFKDDHRIAISIHFHKLITSSPHLYQLCNSLGHKLYYNLDTTDMLT